MKKFWGLLILACVMSAGVASAQQAKFVIQQTEVAVYDAAAVDALVAGLQATIDALQVQVDAIIPVTIPLAIADVTGLQASLDGKVMVGGTAMVLWAGTQAEYDLIGTPAATTVYVILP